MEDEAFENLINRKYGDRTLTLVEVEEILSEAVKRRIIQREDIRPVKKETTPRHLLTNIRQWKTDFLKSSFDLNNSFFSEKAESKVADSKVAESKVAESKAVEEYGIDGNEFVSFYDDLRETTRMINEKTDEKMRGIFKDVFSKIKKKNRNKKSQRLFFPALFLLVVLGFGFYFFFTAQPI